MSPAGVIVPALALWLAAAIVYQCVAWAALRRLLTRRPGPAPVEPPSCTILRSLHGSSPRLEENLESLLGAGAPVVVSAGDGDGPSAAAARRVAARHPEAPLTVRIGRAPEGANRKVASLLRLLADARGEVVVFTDADVATPPGYLEAVLAPFADPAVGLVTCPYRSVGGRAISERTDVLLTNTGFLPSIAVAERLEGIRFGLGATIAVRRRALDQVGGLQTLVDHLADDHALAALVSGAGHAIVLAPILLDHHVDGAGWREVWRRHVRWARTTRLLRPGGYAGSIVMHGSVPAIALALGGTWTALAGLVTWLLVRGSGAALLRERLGLTPRDLLLMPVADLAAFGVYLAGLAGRGVEWGGRRLRVSRDGRLGPSDSTYGSGAGRMLKGGRAWPARGGGGSPFFG